MMLVSFYLPVWLGELYIKEMPSTIMLVGFYLPVRFWEQLLLLRGTCPNDDASRFLPSCAVRYAFVRMLFFLKERLPYVMLVGFCIPVRLS